MAFGIASKRKGKHPDPDEPLILAFSGPIQSGKSTVSEELARILNVSVASFGRYVRDQAKARTNESLGLRPIEDRMRLQEVGQELLETLGADEFCRAVLTTFGWVEGRSIVVDGVRHFAILQALERLGNCYLVYLEVAPARRRAGLLASGYTEDDIAVMEAHPTESELVTLKKNANLVLDEDKPVDELIKSVLEKLNVTPSLGDIRGGALTLKWGLEYEPDDARLGFRALHATELVDQLGAGSSRITRYRDEGKIFAHENGELTFPEWQFDDSGEPFPVVAEVLNYLRPYLTEQEVAKWFVEEQQFLDASLPYELIQKDPLRLVAAARTAKELIDPDSVRTWKDTASSDPGDSSDVREVERWHAEILEVDDKAGHFLARMVNSSGPSAPKDASFPIDQVHPRDRHRLAQGVAFTWVVTERDLTESRQRCSTIMFSAPRYLTGTEIAEALETADELLEVLGHD